MFAGWTYYTEPCKTEGFSGGQGSLREDVATARPVSAPWFRLEGRLDRFDLVTTGS